jgi:asparagine synthetase B (glutamine-hydrolysing)
VVCHAASRVVVCPHLPVDVQPMVDPATDHVMVLDGEIYNLLELRNHLAVQVDW